MVTSDSRVILRNCRGVPSGSGAVEAVVRCDADMRTDTVFLPFHFPGAERANLVTLPELDSFSRMPKFKACAVRMEAA